MALTIRIDPEITQLWPETCLGCLRLSLTVTPYSQELWDFYVSHIETNLKQKLKNSKLTDLPGIDSARKAFKAFGIDPGRLRVSSEALYRRLRQDKDIYQINSVVDVNNLVSLETGFSLGSYDCEHIGSEITLRRGKEGERYAGIGKKEMQIHNMPLLADDQGPFGSPISDSTRGMITAQSTEVLTVIYCFSGKKKLEPALKLACEQFQQFTKIHSFESFLVD